MTGLTNTIKKYFSIFILYSLLAASFLSPLASNVAMPAVTDLISHANLVVLASKALKEGQFPLRVAPGMRDNLFFYPQFQFYSPLVYIITGYVHQIFTPSNPYTAIKLVIWFGLVISAFYMYFLIKEITGDIVAAILSGIAYMAGPYFLTNILVRGDFTESVAQSILPAVLYYCCQPFLKKQVTVVNFFISALVWSLLAVTHLITFINSSLTIILFLCLFKVENRLKKLIWSGLAYVFSFLLAAWYLGPIIIFHSILKISNSLNDPYITNFLTLFQNLIAVFTNSLSPLTTTRTGPDFILNPVLCPAVGLTVLLAVGLCSYMIWLHANKDILNNRNIIKLFLIIFYLCFFITWSPVDFWKYVPKILVVEQFSYRFAAQTLLFGAFLVGISINYLSKGKNATQTLILGIIIICFSSSSWLVASYPGIEVSAIAGAYGGDDYLTAKIRKKNNLSVSSKVMNHEYVRSNCKKNHTELNCRLSLPTEGLIELPVFYYPNLLKVMVDDNKMIYFPSKFNNYFLAALKLKPGLHNITIRFNGLVWANWLSLIAWFILIVFFTINLIKLVFKKRNFSSNLDVVY